MNVLVAVSIGYLLGSFLPAYFLTKWILGIDIRSVGSHHAGTTNVLRNVGLWPAILTATYDLAKGVLALKFSLFLGFPEHVCFISALSAIAGHVFPFYLQFRGGRGAATSVGILLYFLWNDWLKLPPNVLVSDLSVLVLLVLVIYGISKKGDIVGLFVLPALLLLSLLRLADRSIFIVVPIFVLLTINLHNVLSERMITFESGVRLWRILIRPAAFLLISLNYKMQKASFLSLLTVLVIVFLFLDLLRLTHKGVESFLHDKFKFKFFKENERRRFSSMTLFLIGVILSFIFFEKSLATAACSFLILGDLAAKILGMNFGRRKLFHKTVEGFLAHVVVCVYVAYFLNVIGLVPFGVGLLGAIIASVCELLPLSINDNVSVPLFSGLVMSIVEGFFRG